MSRYDIDLLLVFVRSVFIHDRRPMMEGAESTKVRSMQRAVRVDWPKLEQLWGEAAGLLIVGEDARRPAKPLPLPKRAVHACSSSESA